MAQWLDKTLLLIAKGFSSNPINQWFNKPVDGGRHSPRQIRIALGLTAALLLFVVLVNTLLLDPKGFDFSALYTSGVIVREGHSSRLYDAQEQARLQQQLFNRKDLLINPHPPFEILLFAPLAALSYSKAYFTWGAINVLLWVFFQYLMRPHAPVPQDPFRYLLLCSLFFPLWAALMQGQTSILLLVLFSLAFVCLQLGQGFSAGLFLGFGLFKFPLVLPFAFICLLRGKWRLVVGFVLAASVLAALGLIAVGPAGMVSYANLLADIARNPSRPAYAGIKPWNMPTVKGFLTALLAGKVAALWISGAATTISAFLVLLTAWLWHQEDQHHNGSSSGLMFAAALVIAQLVTPHLYTHDMTLMLLAILLVTGSSRWWGTSRFGWVVSLCVLILYLPPVYVLLLRAERLYALCPVLLAFAAATIGLAARTTPLEPPGADPEQRAVRYAVGGMQ